MLADPQSVTVNAVAVSLPRTKVTDFGNTYTSADGNTVMAIKQNQSKDRFRREMRLSHQKIAADPISAINKQIGMSVYIVVDEPKFGYTDVEIGYYLEAIKAWLIAANYNRVLGGEM